MTVAKLQVGLLGSARQLQRDLDRIAGRADTNTPSGLHYVLQGGLPVSHIPSLNMFQSTDPSESLRGA